MSSTKNKPWGQQLRDARIERNLTQGELAEKSGVSIRTLNRSELHGYIPKAEMIVRLALALEQPPREWLGAAGVSLPSDSMIQRIEADFQDHRLFLEGHPIEDILAEVKDALGGEDDPGLMCVCYHSQSTVLYASTIIETVADLIASGLHLAMFLPYPISDWDTNLPVGSDTVARDRACARYYSEISSQTINLARDYYTALRERGKQHGQPEIVKRLKVFIPRLRGMLNVPVPSANDLRPTLICPKRSQFEDEDGMYLGAIGNEMGKQEALWWSVPPKDRRLPAWIDYFSIAINAWKEMDNSHTWSSQLSSWTWVEYDIANLKQPDSYLVEMNNIQISVLRNPLEEE